MLRIPNRKERDYYPGGADINSQQRFTKTFNILVDLKYGDRDITESCLVFHFSKENEAGWRTTTFTKSTNHSSVKGN